MNQVHIVEHKGKRKVLKRVKPEEIRENLIEGIDGAPIDSEHELISLLFSATASGMSASAITRRGYRKSQPPSA